MIKATTDVNGANLRVTSYSVNSLNQYSGITTPGYKDALGAALATNSVTVNGAATDRKVEYFHNELSVNNVSGPVYQSVNVTSVTNSVTGNLLVAPNSQSPVYDLDGNLTSDGLWSYTWDAENRLTSVASVSAVVNADKRKLVFNYDHQGRRVTKQVYVWATTDWNPTPVTDERLVYDGWNLLAELNATNNVPMRSYLWANDLSGTMDKAGGIGGLVALRDHGLGVYHFTAYDGNGNIMFLVSAADLSLSAQYEYSPFGEDPSEEQGGNHLYCFVLNDATGKVDPDGAAPTGLISIGEFLEQTSVRDAKALANMRSALRVREQSRTAAVLGERERVESWNTTFAQRTLQRGEFARAAYEAYDNLQNFDAPAQSFVKNFVDYFRDTASGDVAYADLDAIGVATERGQSRVF